MFSIQFVHREKPQTLAAGGLYAAPRAEGFRDTSTAELRSLIAEIEAGRPWREAVRDRYAKNNPWLYRIITDDRRTAFFDVVLPAGSGPVLDLGAGWGQVARPLAVTRPTVAIEPVGERLGFIRAAARQDGTGDRLAYLEADYLEIEFSSRFDVISAIGVLEWTGAFQSHSDPQERQREFLRRTRHDLSAGGVLILGIENRLGLKYLLGSPDDHLGVPNIACLPAQLARERWQKSSGHALQSFTYSLSELGQLLREAGFHKIEFFAALPDYKLPSVILPLGNDGAAVNHWLLHHPIPPEHNGYNGSALDAQTQETLQAQYRSLAAEKIAHCFVPSFFVRAG